MKIEYKVGNLVEASERYICHCVNAQGVMASGVAKAIRDKYPRAFEVYRARYEEDGYLPLGLVISADCGEHTVLNLVGQKNFGRDQRLYLNYRALRQGINTINKNISEPIAFPLIGCGLAGGDWKIVSEIIEEESTNFQPVVYDFEDRIPF